jgi:hypothetical protein
MTEAMRVKAVRSRPRTNTDQVMIKEASRQEDAWKIYIEGSIPQDNMSTDAFTDWGFQSPVQTPS